MNCQGNTIYSYWKITDDEKTVTMHPEQYTLDVKAYKSDLWTCVELVLQEYGLSNDECLRLKNKLVNNQMEL